MHNQKPNPPGAFESFEEMFSQAEARPEYWAERARLEFTREVLSKMHCDNVSRTELASRLDVQPGMVTRLLGGRNNFEIATMVRIALALNCRLRTHLEPSGSKTLWFDVVNAENRHQNEKPKNLLEFPRSVSVYVPTVTYLNYEACASSS